MGGRQSREDAAAGRITFEEFQHGGVLQASLPAEEWRGLHRFCHEHHVSKALLLKLFRAHVQTTKFVSIAEVDLSDFKRSFLTTQHQREITDLFVPLVIHQDNDYLPASPAVIDTVYLSRLVVQGFIISAQSTHDLLWDFFSGVFGKRSVRFTNTTFLSGFGKLLHELCEELLHHPTVGYLLKNLQNGYKSMHQVDIVVMVRFMLRYPAVSYAILQWRNSFRRKLFGERMFAMRDPLPSKSFRWFGCSDQDRRPLALSNPKRVGEALYFSGSRIPPEEGGLRRQQLTRVRRSFIRRSQDLLRSFSSSVQPEALNVAEMDVHEWGFQTPEQAVRYTARVLLHDILHHHDRSGGGSGVRDNCLPSAMNFLDKPVRLLSILTDSNCQLLKHELGYKLLRGLIEDGDIVVSYAQEALISSTTLADGDAICDGREVPVVPPSHRSAFPDPTEDDEDDDDDEDENHAPHDRSISDSRPRFDVSKADYWVTDERLQRQFLYNPVTGERRWVVPVFDSHWEPVTAILD